ncbi:MAG: hypothetical protein J6330_06720 [Clostridia bacterium]|nr:hypothetical protein [Clostridia bacterium]
MIAAWGSGSERVISGISAGLRDAGVPHGVVSNNVRGFSTRGRRGDGYAIDVAGDARNENADLLLVSADRPPFLQGFAEAVLVICPGARGSAAFDGKGYVITDGETEVPAGLKRLPLISCGMGGKDTVTFSSIRPDGGMICLQRRLNSFSGRIAEPQEYAFECVCDDAFSTLAAFTALLIYDCIDDA